MKTLGVGVIGMGWMGEEHSFAYKNFNVRFPKSNIQLKLIVCSEVIEQRAKEAKEKFGFSQYTTDWKEVVHNEEVDIVSITTPNALHKEIVIECLKANKHLNCEKPVGATPNETIEIAKLYKNSSVVSFVGYNYRWSPLVQYAKKLIEEGALGKILHYRGRFFSCYAANELGCYSWRFNQENGYGALTDIMSHATDMALHLVGDIESVFGKLKILINERPIAKQGASHYALGDSNDLKQEVTNDDYASAMIAFKNGAVGFIDSSRSFFGPTSEMSFEIHGSKGSIKWDFQDMNRLQLYLQEDGINNGYKTIYSNPSHPNHANFNPSDGSGLGYSDLKSIEIGKFIESITTKASLGPSLVDAAKVAHVLKAVVHSHQSRKNVLVEATQNEK